MPIIGTTFMGIEATRKKTIAGGDVKVNSTPKITAMREVDVDALGKKAVVMEFTFGSEYEPGIANIAVKGELMYVGPKQVAVLKQWKEKETLPADVSVEVLNHLFRKCLLKIAVLADDLQLPPPLELPRVQAGKPPAQGEAT